MSTIKELFSCYEFTVKNKTISLMNKIKSYATKEKFSFHLAHSRYFGQLKKKK